MILYISNFLSGHGKKPQPSEFIVDRLRKKITITGCSDKLNPFFRFFDQLFTLLKHRTKINLVILDVYAYKGFYLTFLIAFFLRTSRIPYVTYLHSALLNKKLKRSDPFIRFILNGCRKVITPSAFLYEGLKATGLPHTIIPNSIDPSLYTYKKRGAINPKLLWVRSYQRIYNPQMAIRVLAIVQSKYQDAFLTMVGDTRDASYAECVQLAKELNVADHIRFHGFENKQSLNRLAQEHDIFINTTNADNAPVTLLEASALGLPIVSTNVDGIPYLFENGRNALLVEKNNVEAMSQAIFKLLASNMLSSALTDAAYQKASACFWENTEKLWLDLIHQSGKGKVT